MKNIEKNLLLKLRDPINILNKMPQAFESKFNNDFFLNWIKMVQKALNNQEDVLPLSENENGVFFDIFIDFHSGAFDERDFILLDQNLQEFCKICGKIESLTDTWSMLEKEPSTKIKTELTQFLEEFFKILPSRQVLDGWIDSSIKNIEERDSIK